MTFVSFFLVDTLLHSRSLKKSSVKQYGALGAAQPCILRSLDLALTHGHQPNFLGHGL